MLKAYLALETNTTHILLHTYLMQWHTNYRVPVLIYLAQVNEL